MNIKRLIFWLCFVIVIALMIWGMIVAMGRPVPGSTLGTPAPVSAQDHVRGPAEAPVTLIEYSDFQCPACEAYYNTVTQLMSESSSTVRFIYRHFPLPQHFNAMPSALASEAAGAQGKFWEMFDLIFTNHADWTESDKANEIFLGYANKLGLNVEQFKTDLSSSTLKAKIEADRADGEKVYLKGTPTFFINGKGIQNPQSYADFKKLIEDAAQTGSH